MLRFVFSGVLKRFLFIFVFVNIFNLDEDIEGEFFKFMVDLRLRRRVRRENCRIFI